jgi:hypothetical protein
MKSIILAAKRGNATPALQFFARFLLTFLLTAARLFASYTPFALAMVAVAGPRLPGLFSLAGLGVGSFLLLDFQDALRTFAAGILIYSSSIAFYDTKFFAKPLFRPVLAAFWMLAVEAPSLFGHWDGAMPWLCAALCAGASTYLLCGGIGAKRGSQAWQLMFLVLLTGLCAAGAGVKPGGVFSVGRMLANGLVLCAVGSFPGAAGAAVGLGVGLAVDLAENSGSLFFAVTLGIGGLLAGLYRGQLRPVRAACFFVSCGLLTALYHTQALVPLLCEIAVGTALYLSLPSRFLAMPQQAVQKEETTVLKQSAEAFRDLYNCFHSKKPEVIPENPSILFDRAAEQVCRRCKKCTNCWQEHYNDTYNAFNDATPRLLQRGRALPEDFPPYFATECLHLPEFLTALNIEVQAYLLRRQYHVRLRSAQEQAQEQFACFSEVLDQAGHQEIPVFSTARFSAYQVGSAKCQRSGETSCGDEVTAFSCGDELYLLLSDGMGSGESAHREAAMVLRLLEKFLRSGIAPAPALKTLNAALSLRGEETGSFTTVDLLAMRQSSGEASLYKYGAAPSYCKRGGSISRFAAGNLPAGLQSSAPEATHLTLSPGSFFVMISDGVADETDDEWLQNLLAGWEGIDPQVLAKTILTEACARRHLSDDCAALVLFLPREMKGKQV